MDKRDKLFLFLLLVMFVCAVALFFVGREIGYQTCSWVLEEYSRQQTTSYIGNLSFIATT